VSSSVSNNSAISLHLKQISDPTSLKNQLELHMNPKLKVLLQRPGAFLELSKRSMNPKSALCPSCGAHPAGRTLDRRFGIMSLRRCSSCHLLYRTPTDSPLNSTDFYQSDYTEPAVTDLPDLKTLEEFKADGFASKGSLTNYIELIRRLFRKEKIRLVDYGCSWGYNTWKFREAGFDAQGVEVSKSRCDFGKEKLGVNAHYSADKLNPPFDVFFSSHVFEHVPSVHAAFEDAERLLSEGGVAIIITPNGSEAFRKARPSRWHELWGRKHPNFLDDVFWGKCLAKYPHVLMSRNEDGSVVAPLSALTDESLLAETQFDLSGEELIVLVRLSKNETAA